MKVIFSIEFSSKALVSIFSINLIVHLLILFRILTIPNVFLNIDHLKINPFWLVGFVILLSFLIVLISLIKGEFIRWKLNASWLTFIFGFLSLAFFIGSICFLNEFRILPLFFTLLVAYLFWKLTFYPLDSEHDQSY